MKCVDVDIDVKYQIQISDETSPNDQFLLSKFKWLDNWVLYLPLFVRILPDKSKRSKCCNVLIILCLLCALILFPFMFITGIIYCVKEYKGLEGSTEKLLMIGTLGQMIMLTSDRIVSLIYYCYYFNFPWYSNLVKINGHKTNYSHPFYINFIVKYYTKISQISLGMYFLCTISLYISGSFWIGTIGYTYAAIYVLVYLPLIEIPCFFTLIIHSAICYKYHSYLSKLMSNAQNDSNDINDLFFRYKILHDSFKKDYHFSLKWSIILYMLTWMVNFWVGSINPILKQGDHSKQILLWIMSSGSMGNVIIYIVLYVISSSLLSETFQSLQLLLWANVKTCIGNRNKSISQNTLSTMIAYTTKYPIYISFSGVIMTRRNIFYFFIGFAATKAAAEAISSFY